MDRDRPAYFISDLHLGARYRGMPPERETWLLRFLREDATRASHLFILGDLFEFWMEYGSYVPKGHFRVLAALDHSLNRAAITDDKQTKADPGAALWW